MGRTFDDKPAAREAVQLLIGLIGPSFSGKTKSAMRLATGMQRVTGGEVFYIDSEARRALHYAPKAGEAFDPRIHFRFRHVEFRAPFGPLDYLAAIEHCVARGAKVIVIDSMSHEHEGPGGVLEQHAQEIDRRCAAAEERGRRANPDAYTMLAWQKPKAERRRLINTILQLPVSVIFCFRAKEKLKLEKGKDPAPMGFMAIAGDEFTYELTVSCMLLPGAGGVPSWESDERGEKMMIKLPEHFREMLLKRRGPLDEEVGEALARWAAGDAAPATTSPAPRRPPVDPFAAVKRDLLSAACREDLDKPGRAIRAASGGPLTPEQRAELLPLLEEREAVLLPRAEQGADANQDGR